MLKGEISSVDASFIIKLVSIFPFSMAIRLDTGFTIYLLYTWNWHNIVNQLHFNKKFLKDPAEVWSFLWICHLQPELNSYLSLQEALLVHIILVAYLIYCGHLCGSSLLLVCKCLQGKDSMFQVVVTCHNFGCTRIWSSFPYFGNWVFVKDPTHILLQKSPDTHVPSLLCC